MDEVDKGKKRREREKGIGSLRPTNISLVTVIPASSSILLLQIYSIYMPNIGSAISRFASSSLQVGKKIRWPLVLSYRSLLFYRPAKRFCQLLSFPFQFTTTSVPKSSYCQPHAILFTVAAVPDSSFEPFFLIQVQIAQRTRPLLEDFQPFFTYDAPAAPRYVRYVAFEIRTTYSRVQLLG